MAFSQFEHGATVKDVFDKILNPAISETNGYCLLESTNNGKNGWYDFWENASDFGFHTLRVSFSDMVYLGLVSVEEYDRIRATTQPDVFRQEWECEWVTFTGKVYEEMQENRDIWQDMPGPGPEKTILMAIDWGWFPSATCVLFAYIADDGKLCIFDEHYELKELVKITATKIKEKLTFWDADQYGAVADHDPKSIEELQLRGIPCSNADKVDVRGNRIQGKEMFFFDQIRIHPRCKFLIRDLQAATWHPEKSDKGEIDESQCTWGHFDAESTFRYLIRRFAQFTPEVVEEIPDYQIDQLSAAAFVETRRRIDGWQLP